MSISSSPSALVAAPSPATPKTAASQFEKSAIRYWPEESSGPLLDRFLAGARMPAFLGISAHTSFSNTRRFRALLHWIAPRTSSCAVLEGTYLTRWNLHGLDGLSLQEAEESVRRDSRHMERRLRRVIEEARLDDRIFYLPWRTVVSAAKVQRNIFLIRQHLRVEPIFREEVDRLVLSYVERRKCQRVDSTIVRLLSEYVIEELAVFQHMCETGRSIELYPGQDLRLMRLIANGRIPGFPMDFPQRTHVGLRYMPTRT